MECTWTERFMWWRRCVRMGLVSMDRLVKGTADRLRARARGLTLGVKLDLMMLVPLLALGVIAAGAVQDKLGDRAVAFENHERAELALASGNFIHELQRERGLSGIAVNTGGGSADALAVQRLATDEAQARLLIAVEEFDAPVDVRFTTAESAVEMRWERLTEHRVALDLGELGGGRRDAALHEHGRPVAGSDYLRERSSVWRFEAFVAGRGALGFSAR